MIVPNSFYIYNHQGKGDAYKQALLDAGLVLGKPQGSRILLMDYDHPRRISRHRYAASRKLIKILAYPHAARPQVMWDGLVQPYKYLYGVFVQAAGHKDVLRSYGFDKPIYVAGWSYSDIRPFRPVENPRNILFAPIHPNANLWLSPLDKKINAQTYRKLLVLHKEGRINLKVRHIYTLEQNGIWFEEGVTFIEGKKDLSHQDILDADLVVSHQTYAYIAIALGVPTAMMAEHEAPRQGGSSYDFKRVRSWNRYKHLIMFPHDILEHEDTMEFFKRVAASDELTKDWKTRLIGNPFDPQVVAETVKMYL